MKLFYFGSVCAKDVFDDTVKRSRVKPSASAQSFESALIKGLSSVEELEICAASTESIAMYPSGNRLVLKARKDKIADNVYTDIIPAVNLPFLKQIGHANGVARRLKKWLKKNRNISDKCVLSYGLYPSVTKKMQKLCSKYNCRRCRNGK